MSKSFAAGRRIDLIALALLIVAMVLVWTASPWCDAVRWFSTRWIFASILQAAARLLPRRFDWLARQCEFGAEALVIWCFCDNWWGDLPFTTPERWFNTSWLVLGDTLQSSAGLTRRHFCDRLIQALPNWLGSRLSGTADLVAEVNTATLLVVALFMGWTRWEVVIVEVWLSADLAQSASGLVRDHVIHRMGVDLRQALRWLRGQPRRGRPPKKS
jgi:hypothetical protein